MIDIENINFLYKARKKMSTYYPPKFKKEAFTCAHCNAYAKQEWRYLLNNYDDGRMSLEKTYLNSSLCSHCGKEAFWYKEKMVIPLTSLVPSHHIDLPETCKVDYKEARDIFTLSPRSSAALLRLCIQKLMIELGEKGNDINTDISSLVKKGLPIEVQQSLDYCRIIGNNAVHPGKIDLEAKPEMVEVVFENVNYIVEEMISRPKKRAAHYAKLPESNRKAIKDRDK